jgi:putative ABC transport system permease protein
VIKVKSETDMDIAYTLKEKEYEIVGTFTSPFYLQKDKGSCSVGNGKIGGVIYIHKDNYLLPVFTEAYVTIKDAKSLVCFTDEYEELVEDAVDELEDLQEGLYVLDRNKHQQYVEFKMDSDRIGKIGDIVPIIFFGVAALVSLTTMIRMVEEQRTQIGTLKALGYGNIMISMKYIMYGFLATVLGSVIGAVAGGKLLPMVIINAYKIIYHNLTVIEVPLNAHHVAVAFAMAMISVLGATIIACYQTMHATAAQLMRPAAPKRGKRILLERIPFIWKHVSFIWKSTIRNLLRYKKKMLMTIFGICGCTALLIIGFGIKNSITTIVDRQYGELHVYNEVLTFENGMSNEQKESVTTTLLDMEEVESVLDMYQGGATFYFGDEKAEGYVYVPEESEELKDYISLREYETDEEIVLTDGEIVVTQKMAKLFDLKLGDELEIRLSDGTEAKAKIGAITENYVYHFVYMNANTFDQLFGRKAESTQVLVNLKEAYQNEDLAEEFLKIQGIASTNSIDTLRGTFSDMLKGLDIIIVVIVGAAGGLAFVVLYNLNTINIGERIRELATLKVLGFYDGEVSSYVFRENIILTLIGIVCGYAFGNYLHKIVIDTVEPDFVMFGRDVFMASYLYATLITLLFAIIINFSMHYKLKKIDMSTSLKSVE